MSHYSEEWCKIWRTTDLLFQKWQEFGEFQPEHSKPEFDLTDCDSTWFRISATEFYVIMNLFSIVWKIKKKNNNNSNNNKKQSISISLKFKSV